jgi:rapamycin-insensitive companion of mTOR
MKTETIAKCFIRCNTHILIVRSLDINLENKLERLHGLRLSRKLLSLLPHQGFPKAIARCLVSIARDGLQERDLLTRSCWATIAELCVQDPQTAFATGGLSTILDCILAGNQPGNIVEALLSTLLYTLNEPSSRHLLREDQDLQQFVASFTDCYTLPASASSIENHLETNEQREIKFMASKRAILTVVRSFPGMIYFCRRSTNGRYNGLESIVQTLHMPYEDGRRHVIELLFEMLNLTMPSNCDDFEEALLAASVASHDSWQVYDGFVASEGKHLLPHISKSRANLFDNYLSILLYSLISFGVIQGLVQVIIQPKNRYNVVRATLLLGEVLHLSSRLLPPEVYRKCHSLPILMNTATSMTASPEERAVASAAISCLDRIHTLRKSTVIPCSLFLDQVLRFANFPGFGSHPLSKRQYQLEKSVLHETEDKFNDFIRDSNVMSHDYSSWNWNLVTNILSWSTDSFRKLEDISYRNFMKKLLLFFRPSHRLYSTIDVNHEHGRHMTMVFCHFVDFLLEMSSESKAHEFLEDVMSDIANCLSLIAVENAAQTAILSATKLLTTLSQNYFLVIGRLTSSTRGTKLLERLGIYEYLSSLITLCPHDVYIKLIVSSLDYAKEDNFSRILLTSCLKSQHETCRIYATNFMRVLLRAGVTDFHKWALDLLREQIGDENTNVSLAALDIIQEACDDQTNLESLIKARPSLTHHGILGEMILVRFASLPFGLKVLQENGLFEAIKKKWESSYCLKYVKIVEDVLNENLTLHFRSDAGTYGRRSERKMMESEVFVPPHFYGQLAHTQEGITLIQSHHFLHRHLEVIGNPDLSTEAKRLEYKAALWSIGHVASTCLGFTLIGSTSVIQDIVKAAADCPVLSIRGTTFYVLGLIASTDSGIQRLKEYGWQGLSHGRGEMWPLVRDSFEESNMVSCFKRKNYSHSVSSVGTKVTDPLDFLGASSSRRLHSLRGLDSPADINEDCYGSMNHDDSRSRASSSAVNLTMRSMKEVEVHVVGNESVNGEERSRLDQITTDSRSRSSSCNNESSAYGSLSGTNVQNTPNPVMKLNVSQLPSRLSPIPSVDSSITNSNHNHVIPGCFIPASAMLPLLSPSKNPPSHQSHFNFNLIHSTTRTVPNLSSELSELSQAFESTLPSSTDAHGYATLRAINRHRVPSFGMSPLDHSHFSELSPDESPTSSPSPTRDGDLSGDSKFFFSSLHFHSGHFIDRTFEIDYELQESDQLLEESKPKSFMGIVVPTSLQLLFNPPSSIKHPSSLLSVPVMPKSDLSYSSVSTEIVEKNQDKAENIEVSPTDTEKTIPDDEVGEPTDSKADLSDPLELHTSSNCLLCYKVFPPESPNLSACGELVLDVMSKCN